MRAHRTYPFDLNGAANGNLLDQTCVFATSCIAYGPSHGLTDWPLLVCGRAGGALKPGMHVRVEGEDSASRVPLTVLRAMGVPSAEWGVGPLHTNRPVTELLTSA